MALKQIGALLLQQGNTLREAIRARRARKHPGLEPAPVEFSLDTKSWKTSLLGLLAGVTGSSAVGWTKPDGTVNWISVALGLALTILGYLAKDHNVSTAPPAK